MGDFNLPEFGKGQKLKAGEMNSFVRSLLSLLVSGDGIKISQLENKIVISNSYPNSGRDNKTLLAEVYAVHDNYLECKLVNPINFEGTVEVNVAKPYWLRKTPYDGKKAKFCNGIVVQYTYTNGYTRTATIVSGGSGSFVEMITPLYQLHDDNVNIDDEDEETPPTNFIGHGTLIQVERANTGLMDEADPPKPIAYTEVVTGNGRDWAVEP